MKRISLILAVFLLLSAFGGCSCDNSDHYSTPNINTAPSGSVQSTSLSEISAPPIGSSEYTMLCTFLQSSRYYDKAGVVIDTQWDMKSWYDFTAEKTESGLRLKFTIARRSYTYTSSGTSTVIYDTADESTRYSDSEIYFDIIGYGFTADFDEEYRIKSVGGTDKLYSEVEGSEYLLGEAEIRAVAEELLLSLPENVTKDTVITHSQTVDYKSSMEMEYKASKLSDSILKFSMSPVSEYGLPETETGVGYIVEYTDAEKYSGTLDIMSSDRLIQSSTNKITYYSTMNIEVDSGEIYVLDGITTVTDGCEVSVK